jgi:hypothetical protein
VTPRIAPTSTRDEKARLLCQVLREQSGEDGGVINLQSRDLGPGSFDGRLLALSFVVASRGFDPSIHSLLRPYPPHCLAFTFAIDSA